MRTGWKWFFGGRGKGKSGKNGKRGGDLDIGSLEDLG